MLKIALILLLIICFSSCKSSNKAIAAKPNTVKILEKPKSTANTHNSKKANDIINYAEKFNGVKYKYGGDSKKGMDCSGLVSVSFKSEDVLLPRTTKDLAVSGEWIDLKEVQKGDLLFFATKKNSRNVNHVAIVTSAKTGNVEFIHATTSSGVITSNLAERYWYYSFVQARRIL